MRGYFLEGEVELYNQEDEECLVDDEAVVGVCRDGQRRSTNGPRILLLPRNLLFQRSQQVTAVNNLSSNAGTTIGKPMAVFVTE
jgi:hypothetical protein